MNTGTLENHDTHYFLRFDVAGVRYGVDVMAVKEVIEHWHGCDDVTDIDGAAVPVMDLREHFNVENICTADAPVIVIEFGGRNVAVVVDAVHDIARISGAAVRQPEAFGYTLSANFVSCLADNGGETLMILDVAHISRDVRPAFDRIAA